MSKEISLDNLVSAHVWQIKDSCGPALIKTTLKYAGARNNNVTQKSIKKDVYSNFPPPWDGSYPDDIKRYLKNYFEDVEISENETLKSAKNILDKGHLLMALLTDDFPTIDNDKPDGHYLGICRVNPNKGVVTVIDSSNALRFYDDKGIVISDLANNGWHKSEKRPIYNIEIPKFTENWHDSLYPTARIAKGLLIRINPVSLKKNK